MIAIYAAANVFNPYLNLKGHIKTASKSLSAVLSEIDSRLDQGKGRKSAVNHVDGDIRSVMQKHLATARMEGFQHAAKISKVSMPVLYGKQIGDAASKRAGRVNDWMLDTTRRTLKRTPDSQYILSPERALNVAQFETGRAYFRGVRDGLKKSGYRKGWITGEGDSCPNCLLAEDEGLIPVAAVFDSGDWGPPAHLNCPCWLRLSK